MRHPKLLLGAALLFTVLPLAAAAGYVLLSPNHKWGDPDEPVEYRLNLGRNESSIPGDAEFDDLRTSFQAWQDIGTRLAFYEGPATTNCNFVDNGLNEVSFDDCGNNCTGSCLAVTRSIVDPQGEQMWQLGPDGFVNAIAKRDADILFNPTTNFWSPSEGNCTGNQFSVIGVATHEIGHLLGLGHSPDPLATMEATIAPCSRLEESLYVDDINGLQQLYSLASEEYLYFDQTNGQIGFTVNNSGNFGYTGQGGRWGRSFEYPIGTTNLFEGGLALGTAAGAGLSDDFRRVAAGQDGDFLQRSGIEVYDGTDPLQVTTTTYDDSRGESTYGVFVTQRSFLWPSGADGNYSVLLYRVRNDSQARIEGLHVGLFMDWDLQTFYEHNGVHYDADVQLGWVSDPSTAVQTGVCVLNPEGVSTYRALYATAESYTESNKKAWFFSGFERTEIPDSDIGMLIVTGPFTLDPGQTIHAGFAILGAGSHDDLRASAERAKSKWILVRDFPDDPSTAQDAGISPRLLLGQNRPNPFRGETRIGFSMLRPGPARLEVYDASGRLVRLLVDRELTKESYEVAWDGRNDLGRRVAPGVYFYRLQTKEGQQERKLLVLE
ncbi:MAG: matrixin family metalloprotease [Candidatus Eisenbacteria bacterium]